MADEEDKSTGALIQKCLERDWRLIMNSIESRKRGFSPFDVIVQFTLPRPDKRDD